MIAKQFIRDHGLEQARNLQGMLKNLGCPDDMKFTVINGMWHRSSEGFRYDDLCAAIADQDRTDYVSDIRNHIAPTTVIIERGEHE
ncbi:hypothetical protein EXE25_19000 [Acinetobacter bouvetii]|uniref:Uncharacterized protein n=1 Tax=Acinetobacter bouvetii TaxID=202951 RepID=A0A4Q7AL01_9GAMM|nr:hypothetical protein [Acinetobacter bouvetii]RZG63617.1 hypothetical protein EXE25_19000 [Acinetobacter bouvetii]